MVTLVGLQFGYLLGGAIVIEEIFSLPGMGRLVLRSIAQRDFPLVQGVLLLAGPAWCSSTSAWTCSTWPSIPGCGAADASATRYRVAGAIVVALAGASGRALRPARGAPRRPARTMNLRARLAAPAAGHVLGTDQFGRDVLSRVIHGTRISLGVGLGAVALSIGAGLAWARWPA